MLDQLRIPHHRAPGEAEAECARLQALGIVDAIWSDDGDAFMFGCGTLIKQHKIAGKIVKDHIKVFSAEMIREKFDLDSDSLVLFAMLAGGDYSTDGLRGCGPKTAVQVAKRETVLASALCHASQADLPVWREKLQETLRRNGKSIEVPWTFPDFKALCHYRSPQVSEAEQLHNLRGLKHGWDRPIDQVKLRVILRERFNFTTREFMKHIIPIFLTRALARATEQQKTANLAFNVRLKRTRKAKPGEESSPKAEVKITFSPMPVVEVDLRGRPPEEDWSKFEKPGVPYDPTQDMECEVLDSFLRHGLPDNALDIETPAKGKRANKDGPSESSSPAQDSGLNTTKAPAQGSAQLPAPKKRGRPRKDAEPYAAGQEPQRKRQKKAITAQSEQLPVPVFQQPRALPQAPAKVVNLCADDSGSDSETGGANLFVQEAKGPTTRSDPDATSPAPDVELQGVVPGGIISAQTLRGLRVASTLLKTRTNQQIMPTPQASVPQARAHEVIDLT